MSRHFRQHSYAATNSSIIGTLSQIDLIKYQALGNDYLVLDMHAAPSTADVLLVQPISPQLLGNLRSMFPAARVIVAEVEDADLGVSHRGPVGRMLDSGAEAYLASATVPGLARQLDRAVTRRPEIAAAADRPRLEIEPPA